MAISLSLTVATGIGVAVLVRTGYQRIGAGTVTGLFGFSLASTGAAPGINSAIQTIAGWLASL